MIKDMEVIKEHTHRHSPSRESNPSLPATNKKKEKRKKKKKNHRINPIFEICTASTIPNTP